MLESSRPLVAAFHAYISRSFQEIYAYVQKRQMGKGVHVLDLFTGILLGRIALSAIPKISKHAKMNFQ